MSEAEKLDYYQQQRAALEALKRSEQFQRQQARAQTQLLALQRRVASSASGGLMGQILTARSGAHCE